MLARAPAYTDQGESFAEDVKQNLESEHFRKPTCPVLRLIGFVQTFASV